MAQISVWVSPFRHPVPMALVAVTSPTPFIFYRNVKPLSLSSPLSHLSLSPRFPRSPSRRIRASAADDAGKPAGKISDEWGEDYEPEAEASSSKLPDSDPPKDEDEWQEGAEAPDAGGYIDGGNGTPVAEAPSEEGVDDKVEGLKRALVDTVYGTELGIQAGSEVRAEVSELVTQLEAVNPTPAPVEEPALLDGNWVLLYTASSELLPLLAAGRLPLLKLDKISQTIDTSSFTIINSTTLSSPFASLSFSASASFEVRSPARIQTCLYR